MEVCLSSRIDIQLRAQDGFARPVPVPFKLFQLGDFLSIRVEVRILNHGPIEQAFIRPARIVRNSPNSARLTIDLLDPSPEVVLLPAWIADTTPL